MNFVREDQKTNRQLRGYWMGGTTNASVDSTIGYSDYYPNASGNHIV